MPDPGWSHPHPSHACREGAEAAERGRSKVVSQLSLVQDEVSRLKMELANEQARCTKLRAEVSSASAGHVKVWYAHLVARAHAVPLSGTWSPVGVVCRAYKGGPCLL